MTQKNRNMTNKKREIDWFKVTFLILVLISIVVTLFYVADNMKFYKETKEFCENEINGTSINDKCYLDNQGVLYEVGIIRDEKGDLRVVIK